MDRTKLGDEKHNKGYNCCQAVACVFCDEMGLTEEAVFKMAEGFGAGMADMQGVCGALSGAAMVIGSKNSTANLEKPNSKPATMKLMRELVAKFREKNGATLCKDLKGIETGKVLRSCPGCIEDAIRLTEETLEKLES
ncbi:MAG: C-GCAxxG-C-C family protein [Lachnospiraceae bacterium]|nr:C-GCAxxG-C-C family protein [Lachnospiraceae bacterium]